MGRRWETRRRARRVRLQGLECTLADCLKKQDHLGPDNAELGKTEKSQIAPCEMVESPAEESDNQWAEGWGRLRTDSDSAFGGEAGIRTLGARKDTLDFESSPFGRSGTSP